MWTLYRNERGQRKRAGQRRMKQRAIQSTDNTQPGSKHKMTLGAHASAPSEASEHVFVRGYEQSHRHIIRFFKSKYLSTAKEWDPFLTKNNGHHSKSSFFLSGSYWVTMSMEIPHE